ncbi:MAG: heparinase II/III family protein [Rhodospirillales bacterium]|nr:heparinase II/III family protein [Rhodospirillales bacterium]
MMRLMEVARRAWGKPPQAIFRWALRHLRGEVDQFLAPGRAARLTPGKLLRVLGADDIDKLWNDLAGGPYPAMTVPLDPKVCDNACPGETARILAAAEAVLARRVDLLGSGPVDLGSPIDWHTDFKSGQSWPLAPFCRIPMTDLGRDSDIKVPWELSRLQWLIPAGQAHLLTGEDRYGEEVRAIIEEWDDANPFARGVNWACPMDIAIRGMTLTWLFHVFAKAPSWRDRGFRERFLRLIYLHGNFVHRHLEYAFINGNHLIADAAGLVFLGLFFGQGRTPERWQRTGWRVLERELPKQIHADGADFEASTAYHRLVAELFALPALFRERRGLEVDADYRKRLEAMAAFAAAYSRDDGSSPNWGDADDGRAIPMGGQARGDHRYLAGLIGLAWGNADLVRQAGGPASELLWLLGPEAAFRLPDTPARHASKGYADAGVFILRGDGDHVFMDCGPVGFAGRGGHGHNDCLSFEAALNGVLLVQDRGTYVYSASAQWRNRFRGTAYHSTPMIDGEEQNRFVHPHLLWTVHDDAKPALRQWQPGPERDVFEGSHSGYLRLAHPVTPVRGMVLDKSSHALLIADRFEGAGDHGISIPYHLAPGVRVEPAGVSAWRLTAQGRFFLFVFSSPAHWDCALEDVFSSPSYGVKEPAQALTFSRSGPLAPLMSAIFPENNAPADPQSWMKRLAASVFTGFEGLS